MFLFNIISIILNKKATLKSKSEQIYLKLEASGQNDEKTAAEYESVHKTMEYEKEK